MASKPKPPELTKYQKFDTQTVLRSEINPAPYNPRIMPDENGRALKRNLRTVGLLAPLVWNKRTGNLVSGHQRLQRLDELEGYPKRKADYMLTVAVVDLDDKTEKEQNLFFNNLSAQGDWDLDALANILPELDYKAAGFTDKDMAVLDIETDTFGFTEKEKPTEADRELEAMQSSLEKEKRNPAAENPAEDDDAGDDGDTSESDDEEVDAEAEALRKADVRRRRKEMKGEWDDEGDVDYTLSIIFANAKEKRAFLEELRMDQSIDMVRADRFIPIIADHYMNKTKTGK